MGIANKSKLKSKKEIALLFQKGRWISYGSLRVISLKHPDVSNHKVGVSVSKRLFKKASDRNRIKRLLREAYRLNKPLFVERFSNDSLTMLFYVSQEFPKGYQQIEKDFIKLCSPKKINSIPKP